MTKNAAIFWILFICPILIGAEAYAECRSCSESYGVDIRLKTGEKMSGYIAWYPDVAPISVLVGKLNLFAVNNVPLPYEIEIHKKLTFYKAFNKITFPVKTYLPTKEDTAEIPFTQLAQISSNPKLNLRIVTTGMRPVLFKDFASLNKTPIYIISMDFNGAWKEYSLAISSSARPIDVINQKGKYYKSIVFFGELLGSHDFKTSSLECVSRKPEDLKVCADAKREWAQLEVESREIKDICKKTHDVYAALSKTANPSVVENSAEYKKARKECSDIGLKYMNKYERQFKYGGNSGFVQLIMSNQYTLLP